MAKSFSDRRVFVQSEGKLYKLFRFVQNSGDGSIYICELNDFPTINWHGVDVDNQQILIKNAVPAPTEGKMSIHGSGMSTFRAHDEPKNHRLIIQGNYLYDSKKQALGARHLATIYMQEPVEISESEYITRKSDFFLNNSQSMKPFNIALFAIPKVNEIRTVGIQDSLHMDDLEQPPPHGGFGLIELNYHNIAWYIYTTKHMDKWPASTHISYSDGYLVPMFLREGKNNYQIIRPIYSLVGDELTIIFSKDDEEKS